jgi:hypothetical protein
MIGRKDVIWEERGDQEWLKEHPAPSVAMQERASPGGMSGHWRRAGKHIWSTGYLSRRCPGWTVDH